jgi:membrane associated rhomboid family serine protease
MALADRFYMRDSYHPPRVTPILIGVLIVAFLLQCMLMFYGDVGVIDELGLTVAGLRQGKVWQLFTFQFLHSYPWPWHVLFNCLGLYFIGRPIEEIFGSKKFLALYLLSGTLGGLMQVAMTMLLPRHSDVPTLGASAGVCGMLAIYCTLNPMQELRTWMYFIPITIRARYLLMFVAGLSIFGTIIPFDNVAHAAHLGGILTGIAFVRWGSKFSDWLGKLQVPRRRRDEPHTLARSKPWRARAARREQAIASDEFISEKVDPILDKIAAHGLQSLTDAERKILETARKKMDKR